MTAGLPSLPERLHHVAPAPKQPLIAMSAASSDRAGLPLPCLLFLRSGARCGSRRWLRCTLLGVGGAEGVAGEGGRPEGVVGRVVA